MQNDQPGDSSRIAARPKEAAMKIMMNLATNRMRCTALALCAFAVGTTPMWSQTTQDATPPPTQNDGGAPQHGDMQHMREHHIEMMTRHLGLSPDQVTQVKEIDRDGMTQMMALHQDTSTPRADKREKMKTIHDAETAKIRSILTDDQKPKFDAMVAREHERMEHRRDGQGRPNDAPSPPPAS